MSVPSFYYSGVDSNIKSLNEELDSLGGGDARVAPLELNCVIDDWVDSKQGQILWPLGKAVALRDPKIPRNQPAADSMKYFNVSSADRLSMLPKKHSPWNQRSSEISQWLFDGFNAAVISHGERESDKTRNLFGSNLKGSDPHWGFVPETLHNLYERVKVSPQSATIALSVWALQGNDIIDLCAQQSHTQERRGTGDEEKKSWLNFVCIECPSLDVALRVLQTAILRCPGRRGSERSSEGEDSHLFVRILLHRVSHRNDPELKGSISHVHIVDLIGSASTDSLEFRRLQETERIARREAALQFAALSKVLSEIRDISRSADRHYRSGPVSKMTSARDSKLTLILAPLVQGNTKTWMFLHLRDGDAHYGQCLHMLSAFEGITDIASACHRVPNVKLKSLGIKHFDTVLPPQFEERSRDAPPSRHLQDPESPPEAHTHSLPTGSNGTESKSSQAFAASPEQRETRQNSVRFIDGQSASKPDRNSDGHLESTLSRSGFDKTMEEFHKTMSELARGHRTRDSNQLAATHSTDWTDEYGGLQSSHHVDTRQEDRSNQWGLDHERVTRKSVTNSREIQQSQWLSEQQFRSSHEMLRSDSDAQDEEDDSYSMSDSLEFDRGKSPLYSNSSGNGVRFEHPDTNKWDDRHREDNGSDEDGSDGNSAHEQSQEEVDEEADEVKPSKAESRTYDWAREEEDESVEEVVDEDAVDEFLRHSNESYGQRTGRDPYTFHSHVESELESVARQSFLPGHESDSDDEGDITQEEKIRQLKQVNSSLLQSLQDEHETRIKLNERIKHLEEEIMEARTLADVQAEGHKIEVLRLKSQMRKLANEHTSSEVLDSLDQDLARLLKENEALKRTNAALETALAGEGSVGVLVGDDPGLTWTASQGMTAANGETTISVPEYRVLRSKLKRAEKSIADMSAHYEELRNKERKFILATKQSDDTARRLKSLHADNEELRASLQREKALKEAAMVDATALRNETAALQLSERSLREERSRILSELSLLRQRVREMDMERKKHYAMNRFISKHTTSGQDMSERERQSAGSATRSERSTPFPTGEGYTTRYLEGAASEPQSLLATPQSRLPWDSSSIRATAQIHRSNQTPGSSARRGRRSADDTFTSEAVSGVVGLSDAMYVREEEMEPLSWSLEKSMVDLHNTIALTAPSILPLVNQLGDEVRREFAASHRQKANMMVRSSVASRRRKDGTHPSDETSSRLHMDDDDMSISSYSNGAGLVRGRGDWRVGRDVKRRSLSAGRQSCDGSVDSSSGGKKLAFFRRVEDDRKLL